MGFLKQMNIINALKNHKLSKQLVEKLNERRKLGKNL